MKFEDLLVPNHDWLAADIKKNTKGNLVAFDRKEKPKNEGDENKWTYVYTVNEEVKYIGNTESDLKKRILPELNQAAAIQGIPTSKEKLAYTNIRLSQLLMAAIENKQNVKLYYTNRYDWVKAIIGDKVTINNDPQNFCFDYKFLLCWHPRTLQPISEYISIETALILRHVKEKQQLPPWNLGLG
jgi:hypothetical protein